jgi:NADH-quinone oxidoreductase subunit N
VAAFVAVVSKGAVFAFLLRYFLTANAYDFPSVLVMIESVAIASMIAGNLLAPLQNNVKRILAYSSIAHLGYLLVAFLAGASFTRCLPPVHAAAATGCRRSGRMSPRPSMSFRGNGS